MNIKESHSHRNHHRDDSESHQQTCNQEKRTAEFTEDTDHQGHITSKPKYIRKIRQQFIEIGKFVKTVGKEQNTEEQSKGKNQ
jgi:hypothetical protein